MNSLFRTIQRWLEQPTQPPRLPPAVRVPPRYVGRVSTPVRHGYRIVVNRVPRPYWEERGWRREGGDYQGYFQTHYGYWQGYVRVSPSGRVEVFIYAPPKALERHPHWPCFRKREDGWFFVHPVTHLPDVSAGILALEKTITEAYEN